MEGRTVSTYLESQVQSIAANAAIQNRYNSQNKQQTKSPDITSSLISVFNSNLRNEIQQKAQLCNEASSRANSSQKQGQNKISQSCSEINSNIADLQSLISWANGASVQLANTPGLSLNSLNTLKQSWSDTSNVAKTAMNNSVNYANEVLAKLTQTSNNSAIRNNNYNPVQETVNATKDNISKAAETTNQQTKSDANLNAQTQPVSANAAAPAETKNTATDNTAKQDNKTATAATADNNTKETKLDIKT